MDTIDIELIKFLQTDGRKPFTEIAKTLGVSEGTIRNRYNRLTAEGVLQIVGMIDPLKMGFDAPAVIGVSVRPAALEAVAKTTASFSEVSHLVMVSGEFDLLIEVLCRDRNHLATFLNEKLMRVPGITRTQTFLTLKTYKMAYGGLPAVKEQ